MDDIIQEYMLETAKQYLHKWFNELGIEGTIEMLERQNHDKVWEIYMNLLREKGLVK